MGSASDKAPGPNRRALRYRIAAGIFLATAGVLWGSSVFVDSWRWEAAMKAAAGLSVTVFGVLILAWQHAMRQS